MRILVYARQSVSRERKAPSTAWQVQLCREWGSRDGHEIVEKPYVDDNRSGFKDVVRPAFERLLVDVATADGVVVWALDRLTRKGVWGDDILRFMQAAKGKSLFSLDEDEDTADETSLSQTLDRARRESVKISRRTKAGKEAAAKEGAVVPRGFGHRGTMIVPEEADLIRDAKQRVLSGASLRSICVEWNEAGLVTTRGKRWRSQTLARLLVQARLAGHREHLGTVVARDVYEPILTDAEHGQLVALLADPARRPPPSFGTSLLIGLIRCGVCGGRMRTTRAKGEPRRYACPPKPEGCYAVAVLAEKTEEIVVESVLTALDGRGLSSEREEEPDSVAGNLRILEEHRAELATLWARKEIDRSEWMVARKELQRRTDVFKASLRRSATTAAVPEGDVRALWPDLDIERRRAVLAAVVDRVVVHRARVKGKFDPDRLRIEWAV